MYSFEELKFFFKTKSYVLWALVVTWDKGSNIALYISILKDKSKSKLLLLNKRYILKILFEALYT